ncbi:MAG: pitrilysin family protein [Candidatus Omnitrophota bacterium]|nr:pitrilysin family protein [Candidatus Omnitrophota bacterium]
MYEITRLDSGLRIATHRIKGMNSAAVGVWVATGSRYEREAISGISHFIEHLLFKGTSKRSAKAIKTSIEGKGGSLNGFTSEEVTCFLCKVLLKDLRAGIDVLSDMVVGSLLNKDDIEKERTVICEEIKMYLDLPSHYVSELLNELLWPSQPLGRLISGTVDTVGNIKRADIVKYLKSHYVPNNVIVAVVADLPHQDILGWSEKYLTLDPLKKHFRFQPAKENQTRPQLKFHRQETKQVHLALGCHSFSRFHPDRYALGLLNVILGANMSSRLYETVREKRGLAYDIASHLRRHQDTGVFSVNMGVEKAKATKALKLVLAELNKISQNPVKDNEIKRAKHFFKGQLLIGLEDSLNHMLWMGEKLLTGGRIPDISEVVKKIDMVTKKDIKRVAGKLFTNRNINLAVIGPLAEKERTKIEKIFSL